MFDIITIGSATCDVFIDTKRRLFQGKECIKVPFGSKILIDKLYTDIGGGAVNTGIAFSRLGLKTAVLTKVGDDNNGKAVIRGLKAENINTALIIKDDRVKTDYSVILDTEGRDRTILVYKNATRKLLYGEIDEEKLKTRWFYFATMMGKSYKTLKQLAVYAKTNKIKIAFNISEYLAKKGARKLRKILKAAEVLVLNKEEAELLASPTVIASPEQSEGRSNPEAIQDEDDDSLLKALHKLGPKIIVITDKDNDIKAFDGKKIYSIAPHKDIKAVERTGAGDAFASSFVSGIIKNRDIDFSLKLALANSESVITNYGARNKLMRWKEVLEKLKIKK